MAARTSDNGSRRTKCCTSQSICSDTSWMRECFPASNADCPVPYPHAAFADLCGSVTVAAVQNLRAHSVWVPCCSSMPGARADGIGLRAAHNPGTFCTRTAATTNLANTSSGCVTPLNGSFLFTRVPCQLVRLRLPRPWDAPSRRALTDVSMLLQGSVSVRIFTCDCGHGHLRVQSRPGREPYNTKAAQQKSLYL